MSRTPACSACTTGNQSISSAIRAACGYVFEVLGFRKVTAGYLATNVGMHKAFKKNGFRIEGVLRKQVFFAGKLDDHVMVCKFRNERG